jgi:hypothetical protein
MKRISAIVLLSVLCVAVKVSASGEPLSFGTRVKHGLSNFVDTEIPLVGKLKDLLPFALVGYCYNEHRQPTMIVLTGLLIYVLYKNEAKIRRVLHLDGHGDAAKIKQEKQGKDVVKPVVIDDSFFVYEGDGEDDADLEEDIAEEVFFAEAIAQAGQAEEAIEQAMYDLEDEYADDEYFEIEENNAVPVLRFI